MPSQILQANHLQVACHILSSKPSHIHHFQNFLRNSFCRTKEEVMIRKWCVCVVRSKMPKYHIRAPTACKSLYAFKYLQLTFPVTEAKLHNQTLTVYAQLLHSIHKLFMHFCWPSDSWLLGNHLIWSLIGTKQSYGFERKILRDKDYFYMEDEKNEGSA